VRAPENKKLDKKEQNKPQQPLTRMMSWQ